MKRSAIIWPLILAMCFLANGTLFAQIQSSEELNILSSNDLIPDEPIIKRNEAYIQQSGEFNEIFLKQSGINATEIIQIGQEQRIELEQSGLFNQSRLVQEGLGNSYQAEVEGDGVKINIWQRGINNHIEHVLMGDGLLFELVQKGNFNSLDHAADIRTGTIPMKIYQRGNNSRLTIIPNNR